MTVTYEYEFYLDDESPEYLDSLESFNEVIQKDSDQADLLKNVMYNVAHRENYNVEGVGRVHVEGLFFSHVLPFSGITAKEISEDCEIEIKEKPVEKEVTNG